MCEYEDTPRQRCVEAVNRYVRLNDAYNKRLRPFIGEPHPQEAIIVGSASFWAMARLGDEVETAQKHYHEKMQAYMDSERRVGK